MGDPNYDDLATWAESDDAVEAVGRAVRERGIGRETEQTRYARDLARSVGRPSLSEASGTHGSSPRRQVRLPHELDSALDDYATAHGMTPSGVIRQAIAEFLNRPVA